MTRLILPTALLSLAFLTGCSSTVARFMAKSVNQISNSVRPIGPKIASPILDDVNLSVLWVGHATALIQIRDKVFLTDPLFTKTVGMLMKRSIEPGIDPSSIHSLDFILISHTHFDHFSYGSLDMLPGTASLLLPRGALPYTPDFDFRDITELQPWQAVEENGVTITAVPVQHFSGRYGFDILWMADRGYTGYVIQYDGITVFFGGDTGYDPRLFKEIGGRFPIDVALLPIGPIEPRDFMERNHVDPQQALQIFDDLGARVMIPIHHRTLDQGFDPSLTYAIEKLISLAESRGIRNRLAILEIGEQRIFSPPLF